MLDEYIFGEVERISPEAPVPILKFQKKQEVLGGAGNVAMNLVNLGAAVTIASMTGNDSAGNLIKRLFDKNQISTELLQNIDGVKATKKTRFICDGSHLLRLDNDSNSKHKEEFIQFEKNLHKVLPYFNSIIISDYNKGVCAPELIKNIVNIANKNDINVFADPKGKNWDKYYGVDCITPNAIEVEEQLGMKLISNEDFEKASKKLLKKLKLKSCLITRGAEGMTFSKNGYVKHQKVGKKKVYDVSGAGDTVIASFVASYNSGVLIDECLNFCSQISSEVVTHIGTTPFNSSMIGVNN
jgi:D-beta-D-heptose 7-phosphate kinase/D-beta-D-heptose 1-phosphate adenosyltransferase